MTLMEIVKKAEKLAIDNSPAILTAIGVTGTLTTAYLTGKATFKAAELIADEEYRLSVHNDQPLESKEKVTVVWKLYIPAAGTVILTIVCIIFANRIGNRRAAAVAAAYSISERAFAEYKEKVVEKFGDKKEQHVRDDVAQDRVNRNPLGDREIFITGNGEVLCYDAFSGRYFKSDMETIKKAQNDINYTILSDSYASLNNFYNKVGLSEIDWGEEVGWSSDIKLDIMFTTTMSDDQRPCICIEFRAAPVRGYYRQH